MEYSEFGNWQIVDLGEALPDKYTGVRIRYKVKRLEGGKWHRQRRLDIEGIDSLCAALAERDLSK